jgi:acyl-CoA synthetase (AMP-forming)/AMP-acid ligase II
VTLGVRPGDRVALLLENSPEFLISFFGIAACRGVAVPLNLEFKEDELSSRGGARRYYGAQNWRSV